MPWGSLFFAAAALLILLKPDHIPIGKTAALALLLAALILTFIDIPIGAIYINAGSIFVLLCCTVLLFYPKRLGARTVLSALFYAVIIFTCKTDLMWQISEYIHPSPALFFVAAVLAAAASGRFYESMIAAGAGTYSAALAGLLLADMEMGISYAETWGRIMWGAWILLWIIGVFRRRRLTNRPQC